jgi:threonylcarbamoyladenosine tRNA methylthiotransferase MtaB
MRFAEECGFAKMHIFPYSKRKGTPAEKMPNQIIEAVKEERAARLGELDEKLFHACLEQAVGTESEVLFEQPVDDEHIEGLISSYQRVIVKAPVSLCGEIAKVKVTGVQEDFLVGELVE